MTPTLRVVLISMVASFTRAQLEVQESFDATPDCDADFALHALALIQSKMGDLYRLQQIEGILYSCNKPMLQKLTEASIRLLHKGVIPTQLTEQLQQLAASRRKVKREKFDNLEGEVPEEYKEVLHYIGQINTNDSLSGNEKLLYIQSRLLGLRTNERLELRKFLMDQEPITPPPAVAAKVITPAFLPHPSATVPSLPVLSQGQPALFPTLAPPSIPIKREPLITENHKVKSNAGLPPSFHIGQETQENLLFSSKKILPGRDQLPSRVDSSQPSVFIRTVPPQGVKELPIREEPQNVLGRPLGTPISAQVSTRGKLGTGLEDFDLLKSRNSIWAEAARFLDQQTDIPLAIRNFIETHIPKNGVFKGNPQLLAGLNVPANTFPLPAGVVDQLSKAYSGNSDTRRYLPIRQKDSIEPEIRFRGLDRYDTQTGRFEKGKDPHPRIVTGSIPDQIRPFSSENQAKPKETPTAARPETPVGAPLQGGLVQVPDRAPGFVEFPTYPPPPPVPEKPHSNDRFPSFPSVDISKEKKAEDKYPGLPILNTTPAPTPPPTTLSYVNPDEITGSRLYPKSDPYNVMTGGQRRFVKVDIVNEQ